MHSMSSYSKAAMERAMKIQEVILRAMAKKITWWQAAEILGFSDRHVPRIRERYEEFGYESTFDKRRGQPSPKRVPLDGRTDRVHVIGCIHYASERPDKLAYAILPTLAPIVSH
jgi:Homeodomain-like domain